MNIKYSGRLRILSCHFPLHDTSSGIHSNCGLTSGRSVEKDNCGLLKLSNGCAHHYVPFESRRVVVYGCHLMVL